MRAARGVVVSLVIVLFAAMSHRLAGGMVLPETAEFVGLAALCTAGCVALSGREWTLGKLLATLGAAQVAFHSALASAHGAVSTMVVASPDAATMVMPTPEDSANSTGMAEAWMVLAHAAAALVTCLILRRGERWTLAALAFITGSLLGRLPTPLADLPEPLSSLRPVGLSTVRHGRPCRSPESRRGPPTVSAVAA
jgi:hypothetical protein